jgi:hypothetical protein
VARNPSPTPADIAMNATRRAELLRGRIAPLDMEFARLKAEMDAAPSGSTTRQRYKDRAKQVLRQKKVLEKRLGQALNQQFNMALIQDAAEAQEALKNDGQLYTSMRASLGMSTSADSSAIAYTVDEAAELQQLLSEPLDTFSEGMDDATLEAELQAELDAATGVSTTYGANATTSISPDARRVADVPRFDGLPGRLSQSQDDHTAAQDETRFPRDAVNHPYRHG